MFYPRINEDKDIWKRVEKKEVMRKMGYKLGSFNLRDLNFANKSSDGEEIKRDFELIAKIINTEKFDLIAIQEVNAEIAIKHLTNILNQKKSIVNEWKYDFSGKAATTNNDPEGYGFIWNIKRLRLMEIPNKSNPTYYRSAGGKDVLRPPYYGRFTARGIPGGSNFEIRVVNVHIRDAKREDERIKEFNTLVTQVLPRICDHNELNIDNEMMPAYTFLAGDYNLRLDKGERADIRIESITETKYTGKTRFFKTVQEEKTSLKKPGSQTDLSECYANNYDHFTYEYTLIEKLKLNVCRVEALGKYMTENSVKEKLEGYRKKVSDHVPIIIDMNLK